MVDEMLVAQAEWLPQYAHAIDGAKQRLATKTVATRAWQGAARKEETGAAVGQLTRTDGGNEARRPAAAVS
jgi:alpha-galactosidase